MIYASGIDKCYAGLREMAAIKKNQTFILMILDHCDGKYVGDYDDG